MQSDVLQWLQGSIGIPVPAIKTEADLLAWLTQHCNTLLQEDFPGLVQLLYRVDVSEARLKYVLGNAGGEDAGKIMALLILERVEQIILARKKYRMPDRDIPEEDRW
jgi:hypothetical protein